MSLLQNSNAISEGGYPISNSLRFQSASSQYLNRTPASASNRKTWTWSGWVKRGSLATGAGQILFSTGPTGAGQTWNQYYFETDNTLRVINFISGSASFGRQSDALYRDPSAWYHVVIAFDTTQATNTNRIKFYINGSQITTSTASGYSAWPDLNYDGQVNNTVTHGVGGIASNSYLDGYLSEVNFIDGQALTPSSFGETDVLTGQWLAKKYTGTYGTNGFYLPFSNGTSTTTLGYDSSGNSNNWTLNNFTRSAGINDCWMYDVPSGNGGASGTQPSSNYPVFNQLQKSSDVTISNSNLRESQGTFYRTSPTTMFASSGKWYAEMVTGGEVGIVREGAFDINTRFGLGTGQSGAYAYNAFDGKKFNNGAESAYGATFSTSDVMGIALDLDNGTVTFYKNNVSQGVAFSSLPAGNYAFATGHASATTNANFGQRSFAYTPPTGFKALCTANLPAATIKKGNQYFDATLYSGNSSTQTVVNAAGFKPDIVWMKARSINYNNLLHDSSRGVTKLLIPNGNDAEQTVTDGITSFNSNGFSLGANGSYNQSTRTYVGWQWKVNGGTTVSNTNGSITSNVQVNSTAGFSIVTYTGTGANATVGHGLGVAPKMIFVKKLSTIQAWSAWHIGLSGTEYLVLNTTAGKATLSSMWNSAIPTSSVINLGTDGNTNASSGTYVAYAFAEIAGFSKFGSYIGNGSADGSFVYTGFKPKYIMYKRIDTTGNWIVYDTTRSTYNQPAAALYPNLANAEDSSHPSDILSNGFKLRSTGADSNASGGTFIYMAFAENPFANSNAQ